jgi:polysaccharide biosynthesis protein PslG
VKTFAKLFMLVAGFAFCVNSSATAAELPTLVVPDGLGVNIHFTHAQPGELEMLAAAGFHYIRMDFGWGAMERKKGVYDFSAWDYLIKTLDAKQLRAVFILDYSNPLYDKGLSPSSDEGRAAFARWAAAAVKHFRGHGIIWEMYNEPNIGFWKPKPDVEQYIKLALAVGQAIRAAEPDEIYIGPATSQIDFKFLEPCFKAGLLEYWAAVSVHPYRQDGPEKATPEYAKLRKMIDQYAPKGKKIPIYSGEWGYSSGWKNYDEAKQGKMLPRQWAINLLNNVPLSIWYDWHDDGRDPKEPEHHFGTVFNAYQKGKTPVYQPKPAYLAAQTFLQILDGFQVQKRLAFGDKDDYAIVFAKGDATRVIAWTTAKTPRPVVLPLPAGRYAVTAHTGESQPAIVADAKGLSITLTDAPVYVVPAAK